MWQRLRCKSWLGRGPDDAGRQSKESVFALLLRHLDAKEFPGPTCYQWIRRPMPASSRTVGTTAAPECRLVRQLTVDTQQGPLRST
eukprot:scaffold166179_cov35-Tisochrysis_lutea.AAC.2